MVLISNDLDPAMFSLMKGIELVVVVGFEREVARRQAAGGIEHSRFSSLRGIKLNHSVLITSIDFESWAI